MKLTLEQTTLANLISSPSGIVENKTTIPILGHIKLTATDDTVSAMATDLDIEAVTIANIEVDQPGACTVPAKPFDAIVKKLPKSSLVTLEYDGHRLIIKSGRTNMKLNTLPSKDFPNMPGSDYSHSSNISADTFLDLLNRTKFAMSTEETRYYLNGVYLHNDDAGDLIAVATDGHRLAKMTHTGDVSVAGVIIPRKTVDRLAKLLDGVDGDVKLETSETKMRVTGDGFSITSKLVDGTFPDYTRVIPQSWKATMRVDAKEFYEASNMVVPVSDNKSKAVKLSISDDTCVLSGSSGIGEADSAVTIDYDGDPLDVGFNSKYMNELLSHAGGDRAKVRLSGPGDAARIETDGNFVGVVMPMRV
jgi:DNA polymerase-3 subunit beta